MIASVVVPIFDKKTKVFVVIRCKLMNISQLLPVVENWVKV